jgi:hypothetical protein
LLFCPPDRQNAVREALAVHDIPEMRFEFEEQGAQVIANDPFIDGEGGRDQKWRLVWEPAAKSMAAAAGSSGAGSARPKGRGF